MATKVTILGEANTEQKKLKPIEFVKTLNGNHSFIDATFSPSKWDNIELIQRKFYDFDLMFAYSIDGRDNGLLYLGHFNDGVVE